MTIDDTPTRIQAQRALEALRNGVPNADAVRALGCMQPEALDRYRSQLDAFAADSSPELPHGPGTLIAGDFGAGKSHTLSYFEQEALDRNFIVSRLVISKETPLHDPAKLFLAAVRDARLPGSRGALLHELATRIDYTTEAAQSFASWAATGQPSGMLGASVFIHERSNDAELKEEIVNWWSGDRLAVARVRAGLKDLGSPKAFDVKAVKQADLAPVRFEFVARFARALGFTGWVILLDEVELMARYSLFQRAKAYAELARWIGGEREHGVPGVTAVAAITDDFDIDVLQGRDDRNKAPARMKAKGDPASVATARLTVAGMKIIGRDAIRLHAPNDDTLALSFLRLRELYRVAYDVDPRADLPADTAVHRAMRSYVRRWISEWDLDRLYPDRLHEAVDEAIDFDYDEDPDLGLSG